MAWDRTASEVLHAGTHLTLHRDSVIMPDGQSGAYEHVEVEDTVRSVAIDIHGQVILVEDHFYLQRRRVLHLPGGACSGDDPLTAAQRELEEETGVIADEWSTLGVIDTLPGVTAARTHLFLARGLRQGALNRDPAECGMTVISKTMTEAVCDVRAGRITEAGSVAALLLAPAR